MTPAELKRLARQAYGRPWAKRLAADIGMHWTSISRMANGKQPIHPRTAVAIRAAALAAFRRRQTPPPTD